MLFKSLLFVLLVRLSLCFGPFALPMVSVSVAGLLLRIFVWADMLKHLMTVLLAAVLRVRLISLWLSMGFVHDLFAGVLGLGSFFQILGSPVDTF